MNKKKLPSIVVVAILTFITVVFWIFFSAYRAFTKVSPISVPAEVVAEINPNLDTEALDNLKGRLFLEESQIPQTQIILPVEATPTIEAPTASSSASPTASPEGTQP